MPAKAKRCMKVNAKNTNAGWKKQKYLQQKINKEFFVESVFKIDPGPEQGLIGQHQGGG